MEDHHNSRVAEEYYGYHDDGIEYGGWVNGRSMSSRSRSSSRTSRVTSGSASPVTSDGDAQQRAFSGWADSVRQRR